MGKEQVSEVDLLKASLRGDGESFEEIIKRYQSLVCSITYSATGNLEESEELGQEVFINAWKRLGQLKELGKFRSWLCSITRNMIRDYLKAERRDIMSKAAGVEGAAEDMEGRSRPIDAAITDEELAVVRRALREIPEMYREPLVLFYREQKSLKQVAEQLELSEGAAKQRVARGREMLREQIAGVVERTVGRTGPNKVFTASVVAAIGGIAIEGATAAAEVATVTSAGSGMGTAAIMSGLAAKIIAVAAVAVIGVGAAVVYKQMNKPFVKSIEPETISIIQAKEEKKEPEILVPPVTENKLDVVEESSGLNEEAAKIPDKIKPNAEVKSANKAQADSNLPTIGGFVRTEDGKPIADVNVHVSWDVFRGIPMIDVRDTLTDSDGRWQCMVTNEANHFTIDLRHKDYFGLSPSYQPSADELAAKNAVLLMRKGLEVHGSVYDTAGNVIYNALIIPKDSFIYGSERESSQGNFKTAHTDINGNFILTGIEPKRQDIVIEANGYAPTFADVNVTADMEPLAITMDEGRNLSGIVVDINGTPIPDVNVKTHGFWTINPRKNNQKQLDILQRVDKTDAQGHYQISNLPKIGEIGIIFYKRRDVSLPTFLSYNGQQNEMTKITMYSIPIISGIVIDDESEKPINEFELIGGNKWEPNDFGWNFAGEQITSMDGTFIKKNFRFAAHTLFPGMIAVKIKAKGYQAAQSQWMRIDEKIPPLVIRLKKAGLIRGTLLDPWGDAAVNLKIHVVFVSSSSRADIRNGKFSEGGYGCEYNSYMTDANGYFEISEPSDEAMLIAVNSDGYFVSDVNKLEEKSAMIPWAYVTGVVSNESNVNSNVDVAIYQADPNTKITWSSEQTTNADGRFEFFYVPAIPQKMCYGPADPNTNKFKEGPEINPEPGEEMEIDIRQ